MTSRPTRETKYVFTDSDMPELEIRRDFKYNDPTGLVLLALYQGHPIRFRFSDRDQAGRSYRRMRRSGAQYMPLAEENHEARWAGAPFKLLKDYPQPHRSETGESK